jgi:hypothetical protein
MSIVLSTVFSLVGLYLLHLLLGLKKAARNVGSVCFFLRRDNYWQFIKPRVTSTATSPVYSSFLAHSLFQDFYLHGRLGAFLIYTQENRGRPGGNMKVRVHVVIQGEVF